VPLHCEDDFRVWSQDGLSGFQRPVMRAACSVSSAPTARAAAARLRSLAARSAPRPMRPGVVCRQHVVEWHRHLDGRCWPQFPASSVVRHDARQHLRGIVMVDSGRCQGDGAIGVPCGSIVVHWRCWPATFQRYDGHNAPTQDELNEFVDFAGAGYPVGVKKPF
jgi:hypothetical protein